MVPLPGVLSAPTAPPIRSASRRQIASVDADLTILDEFDQMEEGVLELALKREYQAVFGLFRYCVLTQDATYLCNKLEVHQAPPTAPGALPFLDQLAKEPRHLPRRALGDVVFRRRHARTATAPRGAARPGQSNRLRGGRRTTSSG